MSNKKITPITDADFQAIINNSVQGNAGRLVGSAAEQKKLFVQPIATLDGSPNAMKYVRRLAEECDSAISELWDEMQPKAPAESVPLSGVFFQYDSETETLEIVGERGVNADEVREIITEMVENGDISGGGGVVEETDPTVPDWAKQPNKPTYTYDEIKDKPALLSLGETSGTAYDGAKGKKNATDIAALKTSVAGKQDTLAFDGAYNSNTNKVATVQTVADKIAAIVAGANTSYDTLKEIADWILAHPNDVAALNLAITTNANAIVALQNGKQDKLTEADKNALIQDVISALPIYDGSVTDV